MLSACSKLWPCPYGHRPERFALPTDGKRALCSRTLGVQLLYEASSWKNVHADYGKRNRPYRSAVDQQARHSTSKSKQSNCSHDGASVLQELQTCTGWTRQWQPAGCSQRSIRRPCTDLKTRHPRKYIYGPAMPERCENLLRPDCRWHHWASRPKIHEPATVRFDVEHSSKKEEVQGKSKK